MEKVALHVDDSTACHRHACYSDAQYCNAGNQPHQPGCCSLTAHVLCQHSQHELHHITQQHQQMMLTDSYITCNYVQTRAQGDATLL